MHTAGLCLCRSLRRIWKAERRFIGISKDSKASYARFTQKHDLPLLLLSDPELQAIQTYGVWQEKQLCEKASMGIVRSSFLIDEQGVIEKASFKVKPIPT